MVLRLFLIFFLLINNSLGQLYNCSECYNIIKQDQGFYNYCSSVLEKECNEYNIEHSNVGIVLCGYFVNIPCLYNN